MSSPCPESLLFYYGYINSFNSATNGWDNEKVALDIAKYNVCIFGDGIQNPSHPDYANTQIILARLKALKPDIQIYGYVSSNQVIGDFQTKVDQWDTLQVDGIFIDEAGYDFGVSRDTFNSQIVHVRSKTYANKCFVNAWNMDHVIGTTNDASYPNSTYNPNLHASLLDSRDIYLLESFSINTTAYSGNGGFATQSDVLVRGSKALTHSNTYGLKIATLGVIADDTSNGQQLFDFAYNSCLLFSFDYEGTSSVSYGASTAAVNFWKRPRIRHLGRVSEVVVEQTTSDSDLLLRYGPRSKCVLDFSSGAQNSYTQTW